MLDNQDNKLTYRSTRFITGLRAYSALGVFLIHSGGFGLRQWSGYTNRLVDFGKYGVVSFFVISAFTISMSIEHDQHFRFTHYLWKRFLRVAPMYYVALAVAFLLGGVSYYADMFGIKNDVWSLLFHMTFLNWIDFRHQNNLIGVEASVPIEFFYYLVIPPLLFFFRKRKEYVMFGLLSAAILSSAGYLLYIRSPFPDQAFQWSLIKYAFCFVFGIGIYLIYNSEAAVYFEKFKYPNVLLIFLLAGFGVFIVLAFNYADLFTTLFVGLLILICKQKSTLSRLLFENRVIVFLGDISYSIYLIHMVLLYHVAKHFEIFYNPYIALFATLFLSSITYYCIEKPFISLGRKKVNPV